jgi:hypothetical protein
MEVQGEHVFLSPASNVNAQGVSQSIACSVDVQGVCFLFHLVKCFLNAGMPDCSAFGQFGIGINKSADAGTSPRCRNQSGTGIR